MRAAIIERGVVEAGEHVEQALDRVAGKMRVGDVALRAADPDPAVQAAAPADLDRLAQPLGVGRLADQAMVEPLALLLHPAEHLARAVDGGPFLIAGDEQADRAVELAPARLDVVERGGDEAGDRPLHVGGAPAVQHPAQHVGGKRRMPPQPGIARRHHVGMAGEAEMRRAVADAGIEILDRLAATLVEAELLAHEARGFERLHQHLDGAGIARRHAFAADQALRERDRLFAEHGHSVSTFVCICTADCRIAIFCQILRLRLVASISISLTVWTTTGSSRSCA